MDWSFPQIKKVCIFSSPSHPYEYREIEKKLIFSYFHIFPGGSLIKGQNAYLANFTRHTFHQTSYLSPMMTKLWFLFKIVYVWKVTMRPSQHLKKMIFQRYMESPPPCCKRLVCGFCGRPSWPFPRSAEARRMLQISEHRPSNVIFNLK